MSARKRKKYAYNILQCAYCNENLTVTRQPQKLPFPIQRREPEDIGIITRMLEKNTVATATRATTIESNVTNCRGLELQNSNVSPGHYTSIHHSTPELTCANLRSSMNIVDDDVAVAAILGEHNPTTALANALLHKLYCYNPSRMTTPELDFLVDQSIQVT